MAPGFSLRLYWRLSLKKMGRSLFNVGIAGDVVLKLLLVVIAWTAPLVGLALDCVGFEFPLAAVVLDVAEPTAAAAATVLLSFSIAPLSIP